MRTEGWFINSSQVVAHLFVTGPGTGDGALCGAMLTSTGRRNDFWENTRCCKRCLNIKNTDPDFKEKEPSMVLVPRADVEKLFDRWYDKCMHAVQRGDWLHPSSQAHAYTQVETEATALAARLKIQFPRPSTTSLKEKTA